MQTDHWAHVPAHYKTGRWAYDYDERNSVFFVHCGGHRIADAEDSEVAHAICAAFNAGCGLSSPTPNQAAV